MAVDHGSIAAPDGEYAPIGVIGSLNTDLVTRISRMPQPGETFRAQEFRIDFGGKGANQAVAAAKLGAPVMMVGRVGDDMFGRSMRDNLAAHDVDVEHVRIAEGVSSGVAPIFVDEAGRNAILIVGGANDRVDIAAVEAAVDKLRRCRMLLLQLEIPLETIYHVVEWAGREGIEVCLNPAPATPGLDLARLSGVALLTPNQTELADLSGLPTGTPAEAEIAARSLLARGIGRIVVTLGEAGALLVTPSGATHIAPVVVDAVDTTGAGDAFIGAYAAHRSAGFEMESALRRAVAYAADSVTRAGAQEATANRVGFAAFLEAHGLT